jgi:hypothetical protein
MSQYMRALSANLSSARASSPGAPAAPEASASAQTLGRLSQAQAGATAVAAIAEYGAARRDARALKMQARQVEIQSEAEQGEAEAQVGALYDQIAAAIGATRAAYAGSGIDVGSGTPQAAVRDIERQGDNAVADTRTQAAVRAKQRRAQQLGLIAQAKATRDAGLLGSLIKIGTAAASMGRT